MKIIELLTVLIVAGFLLFGCQQGNQTGPVESGAPTPLGAEAPSAEAPEDADIGSTHTAAQTTEAVVPGSIEKAEGGLTIEEVYSKKSELNGKKVIVSGKVMKFNPEIMGNNWLHIQDGTGVEGTNDLTITTSSEANVGDIVVITGTLAADKDFGMGYKYEVIVEGAEITVK